MIKDFEMSLIGISSEHFILQGTIPKSFHVWNWMKIAKELKISAISIKGVFYENLHCTKSKKVRKTNIIREGFLAGHFCIIRQVRNTGQYLFSEKDWMREIILTTMLKPFQIVFNNGRKERKLFCKNIMP